jgi:asparagine synthase (glutamine-hydrolysing)
MGARRLSIVDVAGGRQPMANESATVWAAQNGELYNYPQLRPQLLARGHTLHTHCDTEVLPHL